MDRAAHTLGIIAQELNAIKSKRSRSYLSLNPLAHTRHRNRRSRSSSFLPFLPCHGVASRPRHIRELPRDHSHFFLPSTSDAGSHSFEIVRSRILRGRKKESGGETACSRVLHDLFIMCSSLITNLEILPRHGCRGLFLLAPSDYR